VDYLYRMAPITDGVSTPLRTESCAVSLRDGRAFNFGLIGAPYDAALEMPLGKVIGMPQMTPILTDALASQTGKTCAGLPRVFYLLIHHLPGKQETLAVRCEHDEAGHWSVAQADLAALVDGWCGK
jgi:hypothetical protein